MLLYCMDVRVTNLLLVVGICAPFLNQNDRLYVGYMAQDDVNSHGAGGWIPFFEAASKDLDTDAPILRNILDEIQQMTHYKDGYKLDSEAQFAMGWWFYTVYIREAFVRRAVEYMRAQDPRTKDELALLDLVKKKLKDNKSTTNINLHKKRSLFVRHWTWLMR